MPRLGEGIKTLGMIDFSSIMPHIPIGGENFAKRENIT